jgi:hypothetical protein
VGSELQMIGVAGGKLWHTIRTDSGWQSSFGLVEGVESNDPGPFTAISCAGVGNELQMIGVAGGKLWHTIRHADGTWQPFFGLVEGVESNDPGPFTAISCAGVGSELQMIGVAGGQLWHTIRTDSGWQSSFGLVEGVESNDPGRFAAISCGGVLNGAGPATVRVPDVRQLSIDIALKDLAEAGLSDRLEYSKDGFEIGTVKSQDPLPGTMVASGSVVILVIHAPSGQ